MIWHGVCIHHSATKDTGTSSWEAIARYHVEVNKWSAIGYHFGVEDVGGRILTRIGRPTNIQGAHAVGLNSTHLGLCVVGDYDKEKPTEGHLIVLGRLIKDLSTMYNFSTSNIKYHQDVSMKTCPGSLFPTKRELLFYIHNT